MRWDFERKLEELREQDKLALEEEVAQQVSRLSKGMEEDLSAFHNSKAKDSTLYYHIVERAEGVTRFAQAVKKKLESYQEKSQREKREGKERLNQYRLCLLLPGSLILGGKTKEIEKLENYFLTQLDLVLGTGRLLTRIDHINRNFLPYC